MQGTLLAVNPAEFDQNQHRQVNFHDITAEPDISKVYGKVYRKPGSMPICPTDATT
jgi:hypothetical protein